MVPKILSYSSKYERTDIVFDVYKTSSLKTETRSKRGKGSRRRVTDKTKLPPIWSSFLRDSDNKTELFEYLAVKIVSMCPNNVVVVTKGEAVLSNKSINFDGLQPCNHEEADSRIFTHAVHAAKQKTKSVLIKACDTDILVIAVGVFASLQDIGLEKLWVEFGQGQSIRWFPIHDLAMNLGQEKCSGMLFFHAFTGCDVVSAFRGRGKTTAWQTWAVCPEVGPVSCKLSQYPPTIEDADVNILEKFVATMYDKHSNTTKVDEARLHLFARTICKDHMTPFHQLVHLSFSMLDDLYSKLLVYGASQQNVQCNLKVLATGDGKKRVKPGKFSGQPSHQLLSPASN